MTIETMGITKDNWREALTRRRQTGRELQHALGVLLNDLEQVADAAYESGYYDNGADEENDNTKRS